MPVPWPGIHERRTTHHVCFFQGTRKNVDPTLFTTLHGPVIYDHGICHADTLKYHWTSGDCNSTKFKVLTVIMTTTITIQAFWDTAYYWLVVRFLLLGHLGILTLNKKEAASFSKMPAITYHLTHHIPEDMDCLQTGTSIQIYRPQGTADSQWTTLVS